MGLTRAEKIMVLDWRRSEMANSCIEDPEVRLRLKGMWKLILQAGIKRNK